MRIAINGARIAGPTLAYWLRRSGHEVILVETASRLRSSGYAIDFWGRDLRDDIELPEYGL